MTHEMRDIMNLLESTGTGTELGQVWKALKVTTWGVNQIDTILNSSGYSENEIEDATFKGVGTNALTVVFELLIPSYEGGMETGNVYVSIDPATGNLTAEF